MNKLRDKIVLITGAGKGRGRTLAEAFARQGGIVAANDISPLNVEEVVDTIVANGGRARAYIEDVAKKVGAQNLINQVEDDFGRLDILINHAAVEPRVPLLEMDEWDWHRVLDVNLTGAFLMTQSVGRVMRAQGSGTIFNIITDPGDAATHESAFRASMNGLKGLTQQAAAELGKHGIQVHAVETDSAGIAEVVFDLLGTEQEEQ
jgi:3-oxoacyl-[acyl-carrier protein] reductase